MISEDLRVVIMAGGGGTRLWPLSRLHYPKQFLQLTSSLSFFQQTVERAMLLSQLRPVVICNEEHRFIVAEQLRQIDREADIILEPFGRNTAPAICLAAIHVSAGGDNPLMMVLAADHNIDASEAFISAAVNAKKLAEDGYLATFGVVPKYPETGYGYIQRGAPVLGESLYLVKRFVEKPDLDTANVYFDSREYYWNSGMFMFRASDYLDELSEFSQDILNACLRASSNMDRDLGFYRIKSEEFEKCPDDSVDYAVMEKTTRAAVVPMDAGWSDVGAWSSLWEIHEKDINGNASNGDVLMHETYDSLVHASNKLVCTIGLKDIIVVETKDAVMVAAKDKSQEIKKIVSQIKESGRSEHELHREVYRPWGKYDSVDHGERYQVKRITVKPGERLSTQMHHHRAEHWIVVSGTARVVRDKKEELLSENQSVYIPIGVVHSLENPGKIPLELIEVQSGAYLGEDDIVRFEDMYGRS